MQPLRAFLRVVLDLPVPTLNRWAGQPATIDGRTLDPAVNLLLHLESRIGAGKPQDVLGRRAAMAKNTSLVMTRPAGVVTADHVLADRIPARSYRAAHLRKPAPLIMYLHGGGWVVGDLDSHDGSARMLALHSGCTVVSVDYRLAPEHPFPAGLDDAVAAFDHLHAHPQEFGAISQAVAVAGDSAGANLAAALCLSRQPIALAMIYPAVDLRMTQPSIDTFATGYFLTRDDMIFYRDHYLPDLALVTDPRVSPALAEDLSGMPPTAIWTAGFDPLCDEGLAFGQQLAAAGVPVTAHCFDDQVHGFFGMGVLPRGMERIARVSRETGRLVASALG